MEPGRLLRKIRTLHGVFIAGLVLSGATALPLVEETGWLVRVTGATRATMDGPLGHGPPWAEWLTKVHTGLVETQQTAPFLFYGTDWLAFGHFVIALAFVGAWKDPVRNRWLFSFGVMACLLVIPYALLCGAFRGIPFWWRLVDCSFGIVGLIPVWLCWRWSKALERNLVFKQVNPG